MTPRAARPEATGGRIAPAAKPAGARARRIEGALKKTFDPSAYIAGDDKAEIRICAGTACHASGRVALREALDKELAARGLGDQVAVVETGCNGLCEEGPIVVVRPDGIFYPRLKAKDIAEIVETSVVGDGVVERLLYKHPQTGEALAHESDIPFYQLQERIVLSLNGKIDPYSIDDYLARGGYRALAKVLAADDPEAVIDEVERSGLRGRGGAGYPTGKKWRSCRANNGDVHYVICNADEGDPGAFLDRSIVEANPFAVIEGMTIAGFAIGAGNGAVHGYIYVRREYPAAVERLTRALKEARRRGLLGVDILGSGFGVDIDIVRSVGAFVGGESTALTATIEGLRGSPRGRHIRSVAQGLRGQPTNVNNVETYANVPWIVEHGALALSTLGTTTSKGTKVLSLSGRVAHGGLVEVPMGTTLRQVVFDIGGGTPPGHEFKAVKLGGPSGGCLPPALLDTGIDYEGLAAAGTAMCSGGMVVLDDTTCMVDLAKSAVGFMAAESCGKCVPCRVGTQRLYELLDKVTTGRAMESDLDRIERLCDDIAEGSLCGLGESAPSSVVTTLRHFGDEYRAHVVEKRCPARVCRPLIRYSIDKDACTGCHVCFGACPVQAISGERKEAHVIDHELCIKCDSCRQVCKFDAVSVETGILAVAEGRQL